MWSIDLSSDLKQDVFDEFNDLFDAVLDNIGLVTGTLVIADPAAQQSVYEAYSYVSLISPILIRFRPLFVVEVLCVARLDRESIGNAQGKLVLIFTLVQPVRPRAIWAHGWSLHERNYIHHSRFAERIQNSHGGSDPPRRSWRMSPGPLSLGISFSWRCYTRIPEGMDFTCANPYAYLWLLPLGLFL
jgi:hypothetical protein